MITNSLAEVVSRRDFMPFGEDLYSGIGGRSESQKYSLSGVDSVRKRFTGYQKDQETGLDFAEARYYNSSHGRFTAVDPLLASGQSDNPQSFNRYAYVMNSPTKLIDPSGLLSQSTSACGQCGFKDDFKGLETFQQRVDYFARTGINFLTKSDMALLQFHISNGTALGYSFENAAQRQIRPARQPRRARSNRGGGNGRRGNGRRGRRTYDRPIGPGLNEANIQTSLENNLRDVILLPLYGPPRNYLGNNRNKLANHHIFPKAGEFARFWERERIPIDHYTLRIPRGQHIELHSGIGQGSGGAWNNAWRNFFKQYPGATREQIFQQGNLMIQQLQVIGPWVHYRYKPNSIGPPR